MMPDASLQFCKARAVAYTLRGKVEAALQKLVEESTLEPVQFSNWAAPVVPVMKNDKSSERICGDYRMTTNPVSKLDRYLIPKIEDLFANLEKESLSQLLISVRHTSN